jgi:hypothetical protein
MPLPQVPPVTLVPRDPAKTLVVRSDEAGLAIDGRTGCATGTGERLDLGWAIDVLHPRAARPNDVRDV